MRQDQLIRLQALSEKIAEVAIFDADPDNWVGAGKPAKKLTKAARGNAYWCRKVAIGTISVLMRVGAVANSVQWSNATKDDTSLNDEIRKAEADAERWLKSEIERQAKSKQHYAS